MSGAPIQAVLFDMDGVLVKSEPVWERVVEEAGQKFRGRPVTREEFAPTFGQGTAADIEVFGLSCSPAELDAFYVEAFQRHAELVWVNPEARPALESLRERDLPLAVVTNSVTLLAHRVLGSAKLSELFDFIACADQVAAAKPAPDLVHHAASQLGVSARGCVLVGDSRYDRGAAQAAGARFIGLGIDGESRVESLLEIPGVLLRLKPA